ncbi:abortive infection system antitoxin AbiGi family protein [Flavobacterium psychrophilum]
MNHYISNTVGNTYLQLEFPLIHVTENIETIEQIIENGFRFSYCKELLCDLKRCIEFSYPMVSFSHLHHSQAKHILRTYGHLSIGMKSEWAIKNNLNPVLYFERNSSITKTILESFDVLNSVTTNTIKSSINDQMIGEKHKYYKQSFSIASFSKNFYGSLIRGGITVDDHYCFGAESEWRLILQKENIEPFILREQKKEDFGDFIHKEFLNFEFDDIKYFGVETEFEEEKIKEALKKKFDVNDYQISKIKFHYDLTRLVPDEG